MVFTLVFLRPLKALAQNKRLAREGHANLYFLWEARLRRLDAHLRRRERH